MKQVVIHSERQKVECAFQGLGEEEMGESVFPGYAVSVWGDEKIPEMFDADAHKTRQMYANVCKCTLNCTFRNHYGGKFSIMYILL